MLRHCSTSPPKNRGRGAEEGDDVAPRHLDGNVVDDYDLADPLGRGPDLNEMHGSTF